MFLLNIKLSLLIIYSRDGYDQSDGHQSRRLDCIRVFLESFLYYHGIFCIAAEDLIRPRTGPDHPYGEQCGQLLWPGRSCPSYYRTGTEGGQKETAWPPCATAPYHITYDFVTYSALEYPRSLIITLRKSSLWKDDRRNTSSGFIPNCLHISAMGTLSSTNLLTIAFMGSSR